MKEIFKVTRVIIGYVIADSHVDAQSKFDLHHEFYSSDYIETEIVDIQDVFDALEEDLCSEV